MYAYMLLILILPASLYAYTHFWFWGIPIDYLGSISSISSKTRGRRFGSALKIVVPLVRTKNT